MIPADLAARLRMLTEASFFDSEPPIQGPTRIREIQARLPELLPGQQFTATLQRSLPDGTFQAIVAGRTYTLALNHPAKAGDTLELVVTQTSPRAVFAQLVDLQAPPAADTSRPNLSPTGRLISLLLTGQPGLQPATLAQGKPLLDAPPAGVTTAFLAPALRQAVSQSGLFYESHQSQWLGGRIDTETLLDEPQGQQSVARGTGGTTSPRGTPNAGTPASPGSGARADITASAAGPSPLRPVATGTPAANVNIGSAEAAEAGESTESPAGQSVQSAATRLPAVPERLVPVVQQQLDALATQNYVWQGQVWPGQMIEWEIEDPAQGEEHRNEGEEAAREWNSTLRLTLPRLGGVEARLHLTPAGVALRLLADEPQAVAALDAARGRLDAALAAAAVPLTGFVAERRDDGR